MQEFERSLRQGVPSALNAADGFAPSIDETRKPLSPDERSQRIYEQLQAPDPGMVSGQIGEVVSLATDYSTHRARILSEGRVDFDRLVKLDREFADRLCSYSYVFEHNVQLIDVVYRMVRQVQDECRFDALKPPFEKLGYCSGISQGRGWSTDKVLKANESVSRLLEKVMHQNSDLFLRYGGREAGEFSASVLGKALVGVFRDGERKGIEAHIAADEQAVAVGEIVGRLRQLWPFRINANVMKLIDLLEKRDQPERTRINQAFEERQEQSLSEACEKTFRGLDRVVSRQLLKGNSAAVDAYKVYELLRGLSFRRARLRKAWEIYRNQTPESIAEMEKQFNKYFARGLSVRTLGQALGLRFRPDEKQFFSFRKQGEQSKADAYLLHSLVEGNKKDRYFAVKVLQEHAKESSLHAVTDEYQSIFGRSLSDDIRSKMAKSAQRDLLLAILEKQAILTDAGLVRCAMEDNDTWVGDPFLNQPASRRRELIHAYSSVYHRGEIQGFWNDLDEATARTDYGFFAKLPKLRVLLRAFPVLFRDSRPFVHSVVESGDLSEAELLRFFMEGIGTDAEGIRAVLQNRSPEEVQDIREDYKKRYPPQGLSKELMKKAKLRPLLLIGDLDHDLAAELSGDEQFDVKVMLRGKLADPHEIHRRLVERYDHEMSGPIMKYLVRCRYFRERPTFKRMEKDIKVATEFYATHMKDTSPLNEQDVIRFFTLGHFAERSFDAYRKSKTFITQIVSNSLAATGATIGALPGLLVEGPYLMIAAGATLGSFMARTSLARLVSGDAYGKEEKFFDGLRAAADGATLMVFRLGKLSAITVSTIGRLFGASLGKGIFKSGIKMSLQRAVKSIEDRIKKQEKAKYIFAEIEGRTLYRDPVDRIKAFHDSVSVKSQDYDYAPQFSAGIESAFRQLTWRVLQAQSTK